MAIFAAVGWKLTQHGYLAQCGQIDDATLITEPIQRNSKVEQEPIMQDALPADWTSARRRQRDVQATWTEKDGRSQFGYKFSASVDRRRTLICMVKVSTASEHATHHLEDVLDATNISRDVDHDKGFTDGDREARLKAAGWPPHIRRNAPKGKLLSARRKRRNTRVARTRARGGHVSARLNRVGGKSLRCIGLARATFNLRRKAAVSNLGRLCNSNVCGVGAF